MICMGIILKAQWSSKSDIVILSDLACIGVIPVPHF